MNVLQIYDMIKGEVGVWGIITFVILALIQLSPIKINPLSWVFNAIGRLINKELHDKVEKIEQSVKDVSDKLQEEKAERIEERILDRRIRILRFNDELLTDSMKHSKESFDQVLDDITAYENYCDTHKGFKNDKAKMAIENIRQIYFKCCKDKDFL